TTLALGHARITADTPSELSWEPDRSAISLRDGSISVAVDPAPGRRFRVVAERFIVEVVGTEFRVGAEQVEVTKGVVHILAADTEALITELRAGESWSASSPTAPSASRRDDRSPRSAYEWLARARASLARGAIATAEQDISAALGARPSRAEAAEAK